MKLILRIAIAALAIAAIAAVVAFFLTRQDDNHRVYNAYTQMNSLESYKIFNQYINENASTSEQKNYLTDVGLNANGEFSNVYSMYKAELLFYEAHGRNLLFCTNTTNADTDAIVKKINELRGTINQAGDSGRKFYNNSKSLESITPTESQKTDQKNQYLNVVNRLYDVTVKLNEVNVLLRPYVIKYVFNGAAKIDFENGLLEAIQLQAKPTITALAAAKGGAIGFVTELNIIVDMYKNNALTGFASGFPTGNAAVVEFAGTISAIALADKTAFFDSANKNAYIAGLPESAVKANLTIINNFLF